MLLSAGTVVAAGRVLAPGWIEIRDGVVAGCGAGPAPARPDRDLPDGTAVPGFVDLHVHGGGGAGFDAGPREAADAVAFHRRHGTTTTMASLVSAPLEDLERAIRALADLVRDGLLAGIHLEGPWLSQRRAGAHDPRLLREPARAELSRLLAAGDGAVRMVTLAPELPGGLDAVRQVVDAGALAAIGHTEADAGTARAAIGAGATVATHLFNAMPPIHHRAPGPVPALLADPRVTLELVLDGVHLHPDMLALVVRAAGASRVALVTDAIPAAGLPDGAHTLGGVGVVVRDGASRLAGGSGALAGSTARTDQLFRAALRAGVLDGVTPEQALLDAVTMTATSPANALGLDRVGALLPGQRADLVLLDAGLQVDAVMSGGAWVDPATGRT